MEQKSGAVFNKCVGALGGFLLGFSIGAGIAGRMEVTTDSFIGRSAGYGASVLGVVLQFGLGIILAIIAFMLVKRVVDR